VKKRIAVISNGRELNLPIKYAIDACKRQQADIDLLLHGEFDRSSISVIESQVRESGVRSQRIQIDGNSVQKILDYIARTPSLIFLAGTPGNSVARRLMEEIIPGSEYRIAVPLVLIDEKNHVETKNQSAA
jgi:hypothetical protein